MTLNELAIEYKKTNSKEILTLIFEKIMPKLKEKAKYVFYHQRFKAEEYSVNDYNKETEELENKIKVSTFKLCETHKMDYKDVEQELYLLVLELLQNYDINLAFSKYLSSSVWNWRSECVRQYNFIKDLQTINDFEEQNITHRQEFIFPEEEIEIDTLFKKLTKRELEFVELCKKYPEKNHSQIAEIMGVSREYARQLKNNLKKKLKST